MDMGIIISVKRMWARLIWPLDRVDMVFFFTISILIMTEVGLIIIKFVKILICQTS